MVVPVDLWTITGQASNNVACNNCNNIINPSFLPLFHSPSSAFAQTVSDGSEAHSDTDTTVSLCFCKEPAGHEWKDYHIYRTSVVCQTAHGSLSEEWGGDIYHVLCEHTPSTQAAPLLHCLVWCVHRRASLALCVCIHYIKVCAHPPASLVHVLLLSGKLFTGTGSPSTTGFALNILTALLPSVTRVPVGQCVSVCVCVCTAQHSKCLCDVILLTSLHLQNRPSKREVRREKGGLQ